MQNTKKITASSMKINAGREALKADFLCNQYFFLIVITSLTIAPNK